MGRGRWTQSPLSPHLPLELFRQLVTARATGPIGGQSLGMCTAHCLGTRRTGSPKIAQMFTDDGFNTFYLGRMQRFMRENSCITSTECQRVKWYLEYI